MEVTVDELDVVVVSVLVVVVVPSPSASAWGVTTTTRHSATMKIENRKERPPLAACLTAVAWVALQPIAPCNLLADEAIGATPVPRVGSCRDAHEVTRIDRT